MRARPRLLLLMALVFLGLVISFPVQVFVLYGHGLDEWPQLLSKISLLNYLVAFSLLANIPFILRASQWLWVTLPLTILMVGWNNWVVSAAGHDFSQATTWVATGAFSALAGFIFLPSVWSLLREPKKRWWLQAPRKEVSLPMTLEPVRGTTIQARTFDLSRTGAFIPLDKERDGEYPVRAGDVITVKFNLGSLKRISCHARVVRRAISVGHYPSGIGLQFIELKRTHERILRDYVDSIPETNGRGLSLGI
ncbi:MAG: PilZ domain-containing protein [Bdellovibrionaceae bacterium]|nr:PilZ domain-containing protein [Bdellovibrionales bacterium]MCB9084198.1 PilZ domain-containing protein [Pseudobdellovibrionaceae bacterium]